jgi:hypothetical protein
MAFVKNSDIKIGDAVKTTKVFSSFAGKFEKGSIVTVVGISERGYDIEDEYGNKVIEIGWDGLKKI